MFMVGRIVLAGVFFGMRVAKALIRQFSVLGRMDGTRTMRQHHRDRRNQQRKHKRDRRDQPCPPRPCRALVRPLRHVLPEFGVVLSPQGGYGQHMTQAHLHATHPAIVTRLKRAEGHLRHVIGMIEAGVPCPDIATQLLAVERALGEAKRTLIHDHIDHCLGDGVRADLAGIKAMTKLL